MLINGLEDANIWFAKTLWCCLWRTVQFLSVTDRSWERQSARCCDWVGVLGGGAGGVVALGGAAAAQVFPDKVSASSHVPQPGGKGGGRETLSAGINREGREERREETRR